MSELGCDTKMVTGGYFSVTFYRTKKDLKVLWFLTLNTSPIKLLFNLNIKSGRSLSLQDDDIWKTQRDIILLR